MTYRTIQEILAPDTFRVIHKVNGTNRIKLHPLHVPKNGLCPRMIGKKVQIIPREDLFLVPYAVQFRNCDCHSILGYSF